MIKLIIITAHIFLLCVMTVYYVFLKWMGWEFCLGGLWGIALIWITTRLHYGRWI